MNLYPLTFSTIFKDKLWGGEKIKSILNKDFHPLPNCGETWEISGVEGNISKVKEGELKGTDLKSLIIKYKQDLVGAKVYEKFGDEFPLLIKFIDANDDLSIQVHPNDELAKERHNSFGKTEMWYIIQNDDGATLISGFNQPVNKEKYLQAFNDGQLDGILNREKAAKGDIFFLPAGRVHTIGKGLLLAEIQQTSDVTYRIYDFDRTDSNGNKRELHTDLAVDAIDYNFYEDYKTNYDRVQNQGVKAVDCPYFITNVLDFTGTTTRSLAERDSFTIYIVVEGSVQLTSSGKSYDFRQGDAILIPAMISDVTLEPTDHFKILETFVP